MQKFDVGHGEERDFSGADTEKQHNGINGIGIDGDHAELHHRRPDVGRRRRRVPPPDRGVLRRRQQSRVLNKVLLDSGVLLGCIPAECAIDKVLQPCKHADQRSDGEEQERGGVGDGGVCVENGESRELFLVVRASCFLLLVSTLSVDFRTHSYVFCISGFGFLALFSGCGG